GGQGQSVRRARHHHRNTRRPAPAPMSVIVRMAGMYQRVTNIGESSVQWVAYNAAASPPAARPAVAPAIPGEDGAPALRAMSSAASGAMDIATIDTTQSLELLPIARADHVATGERMSSHPTAIARARSGRSS